MEVANFAHLAESAEFVAEVADYSDSACSSFAGSAAAATYVVGSRFALELGAAALRSQLAASKIRVGADTFQKLQRMGL